MSEQNKSADHLRCAADKLEKVQTHLRGASRNTPPGDVDEIIVKSGKTVSDLEEILREMALYAELSARADEIMEGGDG